MKLKRATYRHIEAEIYAYHDTCRAIRELRERIIHSSGREEAYIAAVGDGYASSAVEWRATKLADNIMLREKVHAELALQRAGGDRRRAYSECIQLVWRATGKFAPGFNNADLQAFYDLYDEEGEGRIENYGCRWSYCNIRLVKNRKTIPRVKNK